MAKILKIIIALLLLAVAAVAFHLSSAYSGSGGRLVGGYNAVPVFDSLVAFVKSNPGLSWLVSADSGLSPSFLILSILFGLVGAFMLFYRPKKKQAEQAAANQVAEGKAEQPQPEEKKSSGIKIPFFGAGKSSKAEAEAEEAEEEDEDMFKDIDKVVSFSQNILEREDCEMVVNRLRPDIAAVMDQLDEEGVIDVLAKQLLLRHIIDYRRTKAKIDPQQFRLQDKKLNEIEQATICLRFMPHDTSNLNDVAQEKYGKIFSAFNQARVQQETLSDAEDWHNMSLRNFMAILQEEKAPAPSAPPAPSS